MRSIWQNHFKIPTKSVIEGHLKVAMKTLVINHSWIRMKVAVPWDLVEKNQIASYLWCDELSLHKWCKNPNVYAILIQKSISGFWVTSHEALSKDFGTVESTVTNPSVITVKPLTVTYHNDQKEPWSYKMLP